jgi:hypothetical protein
MMKKNRLLGCLVILLLANPLLNPIPAWAEELTPLQQTFQKKLSQELASYNKGNFKQSYKLFTEKFRYNGMMTARDTLIQINQETKDSFKNMVMRFKSEPRVTPIDGGKKALVSVEELFTGTTKDYNGTGLSATYREEGLLNRLFVLHKNGWECPEAQLEWNDSSIDVGENFGMMGFSSLSPQMIASQPYNFRLWVSDQDDFMVKTEYTYAVLPMQVMLDTSLSNKAFAELKFTEIASKGVSTTLTAPEKPGFYVHLLIANRYRLGGQGGDLLGQKIYTRLFRVES